MYFSKLFVQSLDALVHSKELDLEKSSEAFRNLQGLKTQEQETHTHALRERDTLITQLQNALDTHSQETQVTHSHSQTHTQPDTHKHTPLCSCGTQLESPDQSPDQASVSGHT